MPGALLSSASSPRQASRIHYRHSSLPSYAITAVLLAGVVIWKNINIGPMKKAEARTQGGDILWPGAVPLVDVSAEQEVNDEGHIPSAWLMALPILAMVLMMPVSRLGVGPLVRMFRDRRRLGDDIDQD
jgi:Na+/H+ antiporter NhaC